MPDLRHLSSRTLAHLGLSLALLLTGCTGGSDLPVAPRVPDAGGAVFNLVIDGANSEIGVGDTLRLTAVGEDEFDTPIDVQAKWKSSDPTRASVDATGSVKGLAVGRVTITATIANPPREATFELKVVAAGLARPTAPPSEAPGPADPALSGLTVYPSVPRVLVGQGVSLVAYEGPDGLGPRVSATWRSLDPLIATVSEAGVVTGVAPGKARIEAIATARPGSGRLVEVAVTAPVPATEVRGVRIRPERVTMNVGETFWLLAEVPTWTGQYDPNIRWSVADPSVASISPTGQLTGLKPGSTYVTATAASYDRQRLSARVPVEVRNSAAAN